MVRTVPLDCATRSLLQSRWHTDGVVRTAIWVDLLPESDQRPVVINAVMELTFDGFLVGAFVGKRNVRLLGPLELLAGSSMARGSGSLPVPDRRDHRRHQSPLAQSARSSWAGGGCSVAGDNRVTRYRFDLTYLRPHSVRLLGPLELLAGQSE